MEYLQKLEYNKILEKLASYCHLEASKKEAYELKQYTEIKDIKQKLEETTEAVNLIYRCSTPPAIEFIEDKEEIKIIKTEGTLSLKSIINLTKILKISGLLKKYINKEKSINAFLTLRRLSGYQQKVMADKIGVDVKKLRELEKDRCLPDSEILWKTYHEFGISPMYILKDKEGTIREVDALLEISEGECTEKLLTIVSSLAEGNKE